MNKKQLVVMWIGIPLSAPTTRATTPDPSIEDDCRQSLNRLQPVQGQQGQIQQVDDAVAVDVAF